MLHMSYSFLKAMLVNKKEALKWADDKLKSETSDGCTMSPDFGFSRCCERHDMMIRYNQGISDKEADRYLRECITSHGHPYLAWVYWLAVRYFNSVGGWMNGIALLTFLSLIFIAVLI